MSEFVPIDPCEVVMELGDGETITRSVRRTIADAVQQLVDRGQFGEAIALLQSQP